MASSIWTASSRDASLSLARSVSSCWKIGAANASVLPVPVSAHAMTSPPASASGITAACTGRGTSKSRSCRPFINRRSSCSELNDTAGAISVDEMAPAVSFSSLQLDRRLMKGLQDLDFEVPRPVQAAVIPLALAGGDVIACAETGTGKTLAFAAPIFQQLLTERANDKDASRELAVQIEDAIVGLTYHSGISSAAIYGGVPMDQQERALKAGVDIVVATPGRLMDHMRHGSTDFTRLRVLVLDEADRMMDMGFWPDVQRILATLPFERQTLLFSATLPDEIMKLVHEMLRAPRYVRVGANRVAARTIRHSIELLARGA